MRKLAIIGGGRMASIFAKNAKEMQVETHCFSLESGIIDKSAFDYIHAVNILDKEKVLKLCKESKVNGVVATTELTVAVAAYVAEHMNLNGIPSKIADVITDKYRNREVSNSVNGLKHPKYAMVNNVNEISSLKFNYPMILKPTNKGGKRGITVINEEKDISVAFEYAMSESNGSLPFIIEEFIDGGVECSVESLSYHGKNYIIQVTEKITSGAPHCVELAHHQPANIPSPIRSKVEMILDEALKVVGIENGACHTEIKIKDDMIYLIEFNARPGGDHIAYPLTELSTGYPYIKGAISIALNEFSEIKKDEFKKKYSGVIFLTKQTAEYSKIFDECEKYTWCYRKNQVSKDLKSIIHNDGFNNNFFIYCDNKKPNFNI